MEKWKSKMATLLSRRTCRSFTFKNARSILNNQRNMSAMKGMGRGQKLVMGLVGASALGGAGLAYTLTQSVKAYDLQLHPPHFPWDWQGWFKSLDHSSIRRGYQVYKQVCAACHSMQYLCYRNLVNVSHTENEAKDEAAEALVEDGPDDEGNMFDRPGKLSDRFPSPYKNEQQARFANNGALPPDLSYITLAREGGEDYIFSLLTGYVEDVPAGFDLGEGQYYNPYFPGGAIGMAQALYTDMIEYDDGTKATQSQLAKDVVTFLKWAAEPEFDDRQRLLLKTCIIFPILIGVLYYYTRLKFMPLKSMKVAFKPKHPVPSKAKAKSLAPKKES